MLSSSHGGTFMTRLSIVGLAIVSLAASATALSAQDLVGPDGNIVRPTKLERVCGQSLARFCPELAEMPGQTLNQTICLKPYRLSLPLSCRAAVTAAMK